MAADKVASVSRGVREVSISSGAPAPAAAAAVAGQGGVQESKAKDRSAEQSCAGGEKEEGEDDIDESDPLWKVSVLLHFCWCSCL